MTTQTQINSAKLLAKSIESIPGVESATVDDWGNYGSFAIFIYLKVKHSEGSYTRRFRFEHPLKGIINRARAMTTRLGGIWEWHEPPVPRYSIIDYHSYYEGHDRDNYKISVRFDEPVPVPEPDPQLML